VPGHNRIEALDIEIAIVDLMPTRTQGLDDLLAQGCDKTRFNWMSVKDPNAHRLTPPLREPAPLEPGKIASHATIDNLGQPDL
jgi:hypothetical protein